MEMLKEVIKTQLEARSMLIIVSPAYFPCPPMPEKGSWSVGRPWQEDTNQRSIHEEGQPNNLCSSIYSTAYDHSLLCFSSASVD